MTRAVLLLVVACGASPTTSTTTSEPTTPAHTTSSGDAPEISRSVGVDGGIIVLWPRVSRTAEPSSRQIAAQIQERLVAIAKRAGGPVDVRPEPERVCPRTGCKAIAVGAALLRNGDACAIVATVSDGGPSDATLVPWAGDMTLKSPVAAFREPPEAQVQVRDYASCATVIDQLAARDKDVEAAIGIVKH
jgi:hypothetical protein